VNRSISTFKHGTNSAPIELSVENQNLQRSMLANGINSPWPTLSQCSDLVRMNC
jgi:hypothetical protein